MESPVRVTESLTTLPAEYWETESFIYGALVDNASGDNLTLLSTRDIPTDNQLNVRIFFANEYELDSVKVVANIVSKSPYIAEDWKGHKYRLGFERISEEDGKKLKNLLDSQSKLEKASVMEDVGLGDPPLEKASLAPFPNSDLPTGSNAKCKFYDNGKCLKTHAFCDICQTADETIHAQKARTTQKSRNHWPSPFSSVLARLADNFRSTFQNQNH